MRREKESENAVEKRRNLRCRRRTKLRDLVLRRAALRAIGAVVVARQHIRVHIAQAHPVVAVLLARLDAVLVRSDAHIDNVLRSALLLTRGRARGLRSGECGRGQDGEGGETHGDGVVEVERLVSEKGVVDVVVLNVCK